METTYKYVEYGATFVFEGKEYKKTSFNRGSRYENGRIQFRRFKKLTKVTVQK